MRHSACPAIAGIAEWYFSGNVRADDRMDPVGSKDQVGPHALVTAKLDFHLFIVCL